MTKHAVPGFSATYYKHVRNKRVLIVGLEPPPFGGISVHIKRVACALAQENTVVVLDVLKEGRCRSKIGYVFFLIKKNFFVKPEIVYYHTLSMRSGFAELTILLVMSKVLRAHFVLVEHGDRFLYKRSSWYKRILNLCMCFVDQQVLMGLPMLRAYEKNGICIKSNVVVDSPFVEPNVHDAGAIFRVYPQKLKEILAGSSRLILMNASKFGLWAEQDIYGFDLCTHLMADFADQDVKLIMVVGTVFDTAHYQHVQRALALCQNIFLFVDFPYELWPLMRHIDLFVRPSRFDNYGISVAEALWVGTPVVASDVAPRPPGTILFKTGDYDDFKQKVRVAMSKKRSIYEYQHHYSNTQSN